MPVLEQMPDKVFHSDFYRTRNNKMIYKFIKLNQTKCTIPYSVIMSLLSLGVKCSHMVCVALCVLFACMCVCTHVCTHAYGDQRLTLGVFFSPCPTYILRQGLLAEPEAH